jgi:hypothetical protein
MTGTGGFQTQAYNQPAAAVAGNFASQNPYFTYDAGPGGLVAGSAGVTIGRFGWVVPPLDPDGTPTIVNNFGYAAPDGLTLNAQQGLITAYLANSGMLIQAGFQMGLMTGGDFWVVNDGTAEAELGNKAYAYLATGKVAFAPAGTVFGGASATGSTITPETFSVTGSVASAGSGSGDNNSVLTVTVVGAGTLYPGASISGTNIPTAPAPKIVAQLTGTTGGVGTYSLDTPEITAASETISGTYGLLTIGTATGTFAVGDVLTGTNVVAGTAITANVSGSGGSSGTMVVNNNANVGSTTITASVAVETKWIARSTGLAGEIVKIGDHP